jgi:hypothetical protein
MAENKMTKVAALFGKKLNEPFVLKGYGRKYRFAKDGLEESCDGKYWYRKPLVYEGLMAGRVSIDNDIRRIKEVDIAEE